MHSPSQTPYGLGRPERGLGFKWQVRPTKTGALWSPWSVWTREHVLHMRYAHRPLLGNPVPTKKETLVRVSFESGREDLNLRPLAPHASALAGLRHAPNPAELRGIAGQYYSLISKFVQLVNHGLGLFGYCILHRFFLS